MTTMSFLYKSQEIDCKPPTRQMSLVMMFLPVWYCLDVYKWVVVFPAVGRGYKSLGQFLFETSS